MNALLPRKKHSKITICKELETQMRTNIDCFSLLALAPKDLYARSSCQYRV